MSPRRFILLIGTAVALVLALIGRGGIFHFGGVFCLSAPALGFAGLLWLLSFAGLFRLQSMALNSALLGGLVLLSLPLGMAINAWDVHGAKAWCERAMGVEPAEPRVMASGRRLRPASALVSYSEGSQSCTVWDRTSLMGGWSYEKDGQGWYYWD